MKNVYVLAAVVVMFGGVLVGCTKNTSTDNKPMPKSLVVETQVNKEPEVKVEEQEPENEAVSYVVNVSDSKMTWAGEKVTGNGYEGTINLKSGEFTFDEGKMIKGEFVVDMSSMLEDGKVSGVVKHLSNEDFFDVEKYPTSKFVVTSSKVISEREISITGDLTIKDKTNLITFITNITLANGGMDLNTSFTIDRTKWDVRYGSDKFFDNLGDKVIKDEISYTLEIVANFASKK